MLEDRSWKLEVYVNEHPTYTDYRQPTTDLPTTNPLYHPCIKTTILSQPQSSVLSSGACRQVRLPFFPCWFFLDNLPGSEKAHTLLLWFRLPHYRRLQCWKVQQDPP